jgi:hypothetical protein
MSAVDTDLRNSDLTDESLEAIAELTRLARRFYRHEADAIDLARAASAVLDARGRNADTRGHHPVCIMQALVLNRLSKGST